MPKVLAYSVGNPTWINIRVIHYKQMREPEQLPQTPWYYGEVGYHVALSRRRAMVRVPLVSFRSWYIFCHYISIALTVVLDSLFFSKELGKRRPPTMIEVGTRGRAKPLSKKLSVIPR